METLLVYISAILAILGVSGLTVYQWARRHTFFVRLHNMDRAVEDTLTFEDVRRGLDVLAADAAKFKPDHIFGINRGGAIVGGYLAKQLHLSQVNLLSVNCDLPPERRVVDNRKGLSAIDGNVLLVDDVHRKGEHMREASQYLQSRYPSIRLRRMVLLNMDVVHEGPEATTFRDTPVERHAFLTYDTRVLLPWEIPRSVIGGDGEILRVLS
jgi:hypoxanthine phosphoribosyltransferase